MNPLSYLNVPRQLHSILNENLSTRAQRYVWKHQHIVDSEPVEPWPRCKMQLPSVVQVAHYTFPNGAPPRQDLPVVLSANATGVLHFSPLFHVYSYR